MMIRRKKGTPYARRDQRVVLFLTLFVLFVIGCMFLLWQHDLQWPVAHAYEAPKTYVQTVTVDPLYAEISGDPIKKSIYDQFVQISPKVAREALEIARQESNYNPNAKNPAGSASGVFQVISSTWKGYHCKGDVFDAKSNIECAYKIYKKNGNWSDWATHPIKI